MGGKTSTASKRKYNSKVYEYVQLVVPKGSKDKLKQAAQNAGQSVNAYIMQAVRARAESEGQGIEPDTEENSLSELSYNTPQN